MDGDLLEPDYGVSDSGEDHRIAEVNAGLREPGFAERRLFPYEKLRVYREARQLKKLFYGLAAELPNFERYNTVSQMQRAALSVVLNLVEGSVRVSPKEQARFTEIAYGSLHEAFAAVLEAEEANQLPDGSQENLRPAVQELSRKLSAYRRHQLNRSK